MPGTDKRKQSLYFPEEMLREIRAVDEKGLIEDVTLFDVYRGAQVPQGTKAPN